MDCCRFEGLTFEYLDGALSPDLRVQADRHLSECARCRDAAAAQREFAAAFGRQLHIDTQGLAPFATVREAILQETRRRKAGRRRWELAYSTALAACLALLCLGPSAAPLPATIPAAPSIRPDPFAQGSVHIQGAASVTRYTFEREGDRVTDCLIQETRTDEASFGGS